MTLGWEEKRDWRETQVRESSTTFLAALGLFARLTVSHEIGGFNPNLSPLICHRGFRKATWK